MVEAEFEALAPAVERTRCPPKITRWHEGDRARLGGLLHRLDNLSRERCPHPQGALCDSGTSRKGKWFGRRKDDGHPC